MNINYIEWWAFSNEDFDHTNAFGQRYSSPSRPLKLNTFVQNSPRSDSLYPLIRNELSSWVGSCPGLRMSGQLCPSQGLGFEWGNKKRKKEKLLIKLIY